MSEQDTKTMPPPTTTSPPPPATDSSAPPLHDPSLHDIWLVDMSRMQRAWAIQNWLFHEVTPITFVLMFVLNGWFDWSIYAVVPLAIFNMVVMVIQLVSWRKWRDILRFLRTTVRSLWSRAWLLWLHGVKRLNEIWFGKTFLFIALLNVTVFPLYAVYYHINLREVLVATWNLILACYEYILDPAGLAKVFLDWLKAIRLLYVYQVSNEYMQQRRLEVQNGDVAWVIIVLIVSMCCMAFAFTFYSCCNWKRLVSLRNKLPSFAATTTSATTNTLPSRPTAPVTAQWTPLPSTDTPNDADVDEKSNEDEPSPRRLNATSVSDRDPNNDVDEDKEQAERDAIKIPRGMSLHVARQLLAPTVRKTMPRKRPHQ